MRLTLKPPNRTVWCHLGTERFILRPAGILEILRDPGGWRTNRRIYRNLYLQPRPMSLRTWMKLGPFADGERRFTWAIIPRGTETVIGYHGVRFVGWKTAGNSVGIHDEAWLGKNVAVEVRAKLMNHIFRHASIERFSARIGMDNHASIFTYRKLGYAHVGTVHRERPDPDTGEPVDCILFEMLKTDWIGSPYSEAGL